jgi:hypothetical protein
LHTNIGDQRTVRQCLEGRQSTGQWPWTEVWSRSFIGAVVLLVFNDKIPSDSTTFLLGAV